MDACAQLCRLVEAIDAGAPPTWSPRRFLVEIGRAGGGVRLGPLWVLDAGTGGRNLIRGTGFAPEFDDATRGQARHFAGIVAVAARVGLPLTRWASIRVGRDRPDSADGRLTDAALEFVRLVRSRRLARSEAAGWMRERLCA